jgi:hypothetical protein
MAFENERGHLIGHEISGEDEMPPWHHHRRHGRGFTLTHLVEPKGLAIEDDSLAVDDKPVRRRNLGVEIAAEKSRRPLGVSALVVADRLRRG